MCKIRRLSELATLPAEWSNDLLPSIQRSVKADGKKVVVLDDDPTGTQTVHNVPVLMDWSVERLVEGLTSPSEALYILTNSRSLSQDAARELNAEVGKNLKWAAKQSDREFVIVSRSDSTLRGHYPAEVDALVETLSFGQAVTLLVPFFLEGGRYTLGDVHYVAEEGLLIPAAATPYARDAAFGYRSSNLRKWVEEKTGGRIRASEVLSISLEDIRQGGPDRVMDILCRAQPGTVCVVNSVSYRDQEVIVKGVLQAESRGLCYLYRTAASFVRVRAGIEPRDLVSKEELAAGNTNGGLFIVGSYVPKTTTQLRSLIEKTDIVPIEVNVQELLGNNSYQAREIRRVSQVVNQEIERGRDVVVYTSRELIAGKNNGESLAIGQQISNSLVKITRDLTAQPRYLVAKGGITSSDVAARGLNAKQAFVLGQVLPGVPVWKLGVESNYPGMPFIVFPGNVGEQDALVTIQRQLALR